MILKYIAGPLIGAAIGYSTNYIAVKMLFRPKKEIKVFGHTLPFTPGVIPKGKSRLAKSVGDAVGKNLITQSDIESKLISDELAEKIADMAIEKLSVTPGDIISVIPDMTDEDAERQKDIVSQKIAEYIAEAVSRADISGLIMEKAPGIIKAKLDNPMMGMTGMMGMFLTDELLASVLSPVGAEIQTYIAEHGEEFITPYVSEKLTELSEKPLDEIIESLSVSRDQMKKIIAALYKKAVSACAADLMNCLDLSAIVEEKINNMSADELEDLVMSVMKNELNMIVDLGAIIGFLLGMLNIIF